MGVSMRDMGTCAATKMVTERHRSYGSACAVCPQLRKHTFSGQKEVTVTCPGVNAHLLNCPWAN
eukprot:scaffold150614_cov19-Tisochrysis_lutea.AAC.1